MFVPRYSKRLVNPPGNCSHIRRNGRVAQRLRHVLYSKIAQDRRFDPCHDQDFFWPVQLGDPAMALNTRRHRHILSLSFLSGGTLRFTLSPPSTQRFFSKCRLFTLFTQHAPAAYQRDVMTRRELESDTLRAIRGTARVAAYEGENASVCVCNHRAGG